MIAFKVVAQTRDQFGNPVFLSVWHESLPTFMITTYNPRALGIFPPPELHEAGFGLICTSSVAGARRAFFDVPRVGMLRNIFLVEGPLVSEAFIHRRAAPDLLGDVETLDQLTDKCYMSWPADTVHLDHLVILADVTSMLVPQSS